MSDRNDVGTQDAVDYRLNLLGIRIWDGHCCLIAKGQDGWRPIGPVHILPIHMPTRHELRNSSAGVLRVTAHQYQAEHPDSNLAQRLLTSQPEERELTGGKSSPKNAEDNGQDCGGA